MGILIRIALLPITIALKLAITVIFGVLELCVVIVKGIAGVIRRAYRAIREREENVAHKRMA